MIELGKVQKLEVVEIGPLGVNLNAKKDKSKTNILLPHKQIPSGIKVGDEVEVFVYSDLKEDRILATTIKPKVTMGQIAALKVVDIIKSGAFLDWGLDKDLFLPIKEQVGVIEKEREYLVGIYIDKHNRLCATMDIYSLLSNQAPYKENDRVHGIVYSIKLDMGAFVAVDNKYHGMIPQKELYGNIKCGDVIEARVTKVREDGKLDLSLREKSYKQMDSDAKIILDKLLSNDGILALDDNSSPDEIKAELNMSKKAFKRAVGRLLKEEKIKLIENGIKLL